MKYFNIGSCKTLNEYVNYKYSLLDKDNHSFSYLYRLLFLDKKNIMFEKSEGYKITKYTYENIENNIEIKAFNIAKEVNNKKGIAIAIYLDNDNRFIETYWAILRSGNNPLLLNTRLNNSFLEEAISSLNVELVISNGKIFKEKTINVLDLEKDNGRLNGDEFGKEMYIMSTGTSSKIKLCAYRAEELFEVLKQSKDVVLKNKRIKKHYEGELKLLAFLPFYHIFGFVANYLWFSFYARTFVLLKDNNPSTIQNTIKRHKVTHIFAVPLLWEKTYQAAIKEIRNKGDKVYQKYLKGKKLVHVPLLGRFIKKYGFKEVRDQLFGNSVFFMISGGSFISNEVLSFFNDIGYHLANGYGMSEVGITSVELSLKDKWLSSGSIGEPLLGLKYVINEKGELIVKGKTLAYYVIEGKNKTFINGEYNSLDLAHVNNGHFYLEGRKDDIVVTLGGENINPNEVENLFNVNGVNETCLIYDSSFKSPILLVAIDKLTSLKRMEEIKEELLSIINKNQLSTIIGQIVFVNGSLLEGEEFKKNRKRLLKDYMANSLSLFDASKTNKNDDELTKKIEMLFATVLDKDVETVTKDVDFFTDLGGTSLDFYAVSEAISEEYHLSVYVNGNPLSTPVKIANHIKESL